MFYIESAKLNGFRTIKDLTVKLHPGLNVIIGKNGTGKSNFLICLNSLLNIVNIENSKISGNYKLVNEENDKWTFSIENNFALNLPSKSGKLISGKKLEIKVKKGRYQLLKSSKLVDVLDPLTELKIKISGVLIKHGIPLNYKIVEEPFRCSFDREGFSDELYNSLESEDHPNFVKNIFFELLTETIGDTKVETPFYKNIEQFKEAFLKNLEFITELNQILPKYSNIEAIRISENLNIYLDLEKGVFQVSNLFLEFSINSKWLPFTSLSDGTKRIFYIISEIFTRPSCFSYMGDLKYIPAGSPIIILLEEPELGLHPLYLSNILQFIQDYSREKQIIVTTHSPQVLDILDKTELNKILISNIQEGVTSLWCLDKIQIRKASYFMDEVGYLSDYWRFSNLEG